MDFVTHLLVGALLAQAFPAAPALAWLVVLFAVLPDFDTVSWAVPRLRRYVRHRGITHTLPFGIVASGLAAGALALLGLAPFLPAFAVAMLGFLSHVTLDVLNWGAPVLWPVRRARVEWTVHAGFVWTACLSGAGLLLLALPPLAPWRAGMAAAMGAAFALYLAFRATVKLVVSRRRPGVRLLPTGNPFVWRALDAPPREPPREAHLPSLDEPAPAMDRSGG